MVVRKKSKSKCRTGVKSKRKTPKTIKKSSKRKKVLKKKIKDRNFGTSIKSKKNTKKEKIKKKKKVKKKKIITKHIKRKNIPKHKKKRLFLKKKPRKGKKVKKERPSNHSNKFSKQTKKNKTAKTDYTLSKRNTPVLLMILDGFGIRKTIKGNAIKLAEMPFYDSLVKNYPHSKLYASGRYVGLPRGQIGNSEVGHMTIGSGRIIDTDLVHINREISSGRFFKNKILLNAMQKVKKNHSTLHLLGLTSDGGVHSHINHLFALLKMAKKQKLDKVYIHCFLDGRDVPPKSAKKYIIKIRNFCKSNKIGSIASIIGRFYAMDRDNRWNREHKAYDLIVNGNGRKFLNHPIKAINHAYHEGETDEFVKPILINNHGKVKENDSIIFFNFRSDRAREISKAFTIGIFKGFERKKKLKLNFICLTMYDRHLNLPVVFTPRVPINTLGEVVSKAGIAQLRTAETEKYPHVTFFFNGGIETPSKKEDRLVINSPKVLTYDLKPEMAAQEVTNKLIKALKKEKYKFIVLNFANPDMVGHSGSIKATIKALEKVDILVKEVVTEIQSQDGTVLLIADHGNCEKMSENNGTPYTAHTTNLVPCILIDEKARFKKRSQSRNNSAYIKNGSLKDVAPTILELLHLKKPIEMTGKSLIKKKLRKLLK